MTAPAQTDRRLKPLTLVSAWLAAKHAEHQETVANNLIVGLFPLWNIMRFNDLDASTALWIDAVLPRVESAFRQSQRLSAAFNANVRAAELPVDVPLLFDVPDVFVPANIPAEFFEIPPVEVTPASFSPISAPPVSVDQPAVFEPGVRGVAVTGWEGRSVPTRETHPNTPQWILDRIQDMADVAAGRKPQQRIEAPEFRRGEVATSLAVEANYRTKSAMPGSEEQLMKDAQTRSAGAAVRQSMNGGRGVTDQVTAQDRKIKGYARVTDSNPCYICALLASRGAVYGKGSFVNGDANYKSNPNVDRELPDDWTNVAKIHNNCRCVLRPVYASERFRDAAADHFYKVWLDRKVKPTDVFEVLNKYPNLKGYDLQRAVDWKAFRRDLKEKPFKGSQLDEALMQRELRERMRGLRDAGFSESSPQYRWAERTSGLVA